MAGPTTDQLVLQAMQLFKAGRLNEAEATARRAVEIDPNRADALELLAVALDHLGRGDPIALLRRAAALRPKWGQVHSNLGHLLTVRGQAEEAVSFCRRATQLDPNDVQAHNHLGNALQAVGELDDAAAAYRRAISLAPNFSKPYNNLGNVLLVQLKYDAAIQSYQRALALEPGYPEAHSNLGTVLNAIGKHEQAVSCHRTSIRLRPNYPEGWSNLGTALFAMGQWDEALAAQRRAVALQPALAQSHLNLAMILLARGSWEEGWREYEWRWQLPRFSDAKRKFSKPRWDGTALADKTILLHAEQGLGDTLQFVRYVPRLAEQGATVLLEVQPSLVRLMAANDLGQAKVLPKSESSAPAGIQYDVHASLMSLPFLLKRWLPEGGGGYLKAPQSEVERWKPLVGDGLRVGLVWAGSLTHKNDMHRSIPVQKLLPLAQPDVRLFSLQIGRTEGAGVLPLIDLTKSIQDFADTAGLISHLDLVITVDTAVAHLAAAIGKAVWIFVPFSPDFRWLLSGSTNAWYPNVRLFRQPALGNWDDPIAQVAAELAKLRSRP